MTVRRRWVTAFAALALFILGAGTAFGYAGEVAKSVTVSRPSGSIKCATSITVSATVQDKSGKPIAGQPVAWSWVSRVTSGDKINRTPTTTNSNGIAKTTVKLACVPGSRVLRATADGVKGQTVLNVTAASLPRTSTLGPASPVPAEPLLGTLLAVLALTAGTGLLLRGALARR